MKNILSGKSLQQNTVLRKVNKLPTLENSWIPERHFTVSNLARYKLQVNQLNRLSYMLNTNFVIKKSPNKCSCPTIKTDLFLFSS